MVGNDVVDLLDSDALAEFAPRFDARVFCDEELSSLDASPQRARRRWRLWAAKEAAYKLAVKQDPATVFSPSRFRVCLDEDAVDGVVEAGGRTLPVRFCEGQGAAADPKGGGAAVHAVVATEPDRVIAGTTRVCDDPENTGGAVRDPAQDPGRSVRRFAAERLAVELRLDLSAVEIRMRGRIPELWVHGARFSDLSLSHHGEVIGFACEIPRVTETAL